MDRPRLRKVHRIREPHADGPRIVLYDPLGFADEVAIDAVFEPILDRLDGTRTVRQIRQSLLMSDGPAISTEDLAAFVEDLSAAGLLDDETFRDRAAAAIAEFDAAPVRAPVAPGTVFPADVGQLVRSLGRILSQPPPRIEAGASTCAVVTPDLPPSAVAPLLDATVRALPERDAVDLVVFLGTDPMPGHVPYTVCTKAYATAVGTVPVSPLVDALLERVPEAGREELRHRRAHTVEIAATYLAWVYGSAPPPALFVLVSRAAVEDQAARDRFLAALESVCAGRRPLLWGSCALSHTGPAYGVDVPADQAARSDERMLEALRTASPNRLARAARRARPPSSGAGVLSTLLELLPPGSTATAVDYRQVAPGHGIEGRVGAVGARFASP